MFKRPSIRYGQTPEPATPYQRAAQAWDDRIGSARVQAKNWRLAFFGTLALSGGLAGGLVWQSTRGHIVPWVVQVDRLGEAQAVAPAEAGYRPTDPQIAFHLARFIEQVRAIPADPVIVRQNWLRAYDFTTDRGALALNEYARANDPFANVGRVQVAVEVSSVIFRAPLPENALSPDCCSPPSMPYSFLYFSSGCDHPSLSPGFSQSITSRAARQRVIAITAEQAVIARVALQTVVAQFAIKRVVVVAPQ